MTTTTAFRPVLDETSDFDREDLDFEREKWGDFLDDWDDYAPLASFGER